MRVAVSSRQPPHTTRTAPSGCGRGWPRARARPCCPPRSSPRFPRECPQDPPEGRTPAPWGCQTSAPARSPGPPPSPCPPRGLRR
eukprot:1191202-Prorocentrum_minimum.AAC.2